MSRMVLVNYFVGSFNSGEVDLEQLTDVVSTSVWVTVVSPALSLRGEQHGRMQQVECERMRATESKQNGVCHEIFDV